jgi:hypothetical protein
VGHEHLLGRRDHLVLRSDHEELLIVVQAGTPDGDADAARAAGDWLAASSLALPEPRSPAKSFAKTEGLT